MSFVFLIDPSKSKLIKLNEFSLYQCQFINFDIHSLGYLFEYEKYKLLIPCEVIYKYFYFNTKLLQNIVFKADLFNYYSRFKILDNKTVEICLKRNYSWQDITRISKILSSKIYLNGFYYLFFQRFIKRSNQELISLIPSLKPFKIEADVQKIENNIIIVENIFYDEIIYSFNKILVNKLSSTYSIDVNEVFLSSMSYYFYQKIIPKIHKDFNIYPNSCNKEEIHQFYETYNKTFILNTYYLNAEKYVLDTNFRIYLLNFYAKYNIHIITIKHPDVKENIWFFKDCTDKNPNYFLSTYGTEIIKFFFKKNKSYDELNTFVKKEYNYDFYTLSISSLFMMEEEVNNKYNEIKKLLLKLY